MSHVLLVIPCRYASTRFPGKSLALLHGKPLVQWVWEAAICCKKASQVVVATDDTRIAQAVKNFGGEAIMTSKRHRSGTDRMAEVASHIRASLYINLQGDEPLLRPQAIDALISKMEKTKVPMGTLAHRITSEEEWRNPHVAKVVMNQQGNALYFSRSPLPFSRTFDPRLKRWRHIGIYAFRPSALKKFVSLPPSPLEKAESLEQLRALEAGITIQVLPTQLPCLGVDTPEDLTAVETWMQHHSLEKKPQTS